ncbi:ornithine cyclodeaminase [Imbroritus primus]|uniref:Ornithine cyclodeaminase n=1 Tax=Imbroritus primus TaxID=3058603 RepID=A0ACD3ST19_9BURK|nr:ornithine cyclodeaminase [Burkholderiaceae bacterium PBA]
MTRYLDVQHMRQLCARVGIAELLRRIAAAIEADFRRWPDFEKSPRIARYAREGVIELMPVADRSHFGFKYVNGHPGNPRHGLPTVMAFGVLSDMHTGYPLLLSELTLTTALRTAATSALAARLLGRPDARCMAIIGNGAQSDFQALAFMTLLGVRALRLYDIDPAAMRKLADNLCAVCAASGMPPPEIRLCGSAREAAAGADIVTTLTAAQARAEVLTPDMLVPGLHVNAVGGDSPGKTELHRDILKNSKVFVEYLPQTRIEGEIQQIPELNATELWNVLNGTRPGRTSEHDITVFDSVGFALEDFSALRVLFELSSALEIGSQLDLIATPDSPKNLFGLLLHAPSEPSPDKACALTPCM